MEFTVSQKALVKELALAKGLVETKTTIPILANVLIEASGDQLLLTATDLDTAIRCSCPAKVKKPGATTIPARLLLDYVRLLPAADIQVKTAENYWSTLVCGRSRAKIGGMSREGFPALPELGGEPAAIPVAALATMINRTEYAISVEESRFTLAGALWLLKAGDVAMVSTDGHRLAYAESGSKIDELVNERVILPRKAMAQLARLASEADAGAMCNFTRWNNHLFFEIEGRLLVSRELTGNFPDYNRVLPKENLHSVLVEREALREAMERVAKFADEMSRCIKLQLSEGNLELRSASTDVGESEENLAVEYSGPALHVGFNAAYILDFLKSTAETRVELRFNKSGEAMEMRPTNEQKPGGYRYITMPMRG